MRGTVSQEKRPPRRGAEVQDEDLNLEELEEQMERANQAQEASA